METLIILIFVIGYLAITLEHNLKIDKLIPALAMMALAWAAVAFGIDSFAQWFDSGKHALMENFGMMEHADKMHLMEETLLHHLGKTAEILFFLMGAMTIVEIIDYYDGFATFKNYIQTRSKKKLLWIFAFLAFILSAIIDNLTATIVLISILQKIIKDTNTKLWFGGMIIVAANAGGAWSPIGDVTTTMLWIGDKVTTGKLLSYLLLPSLLTMIIPTFIASFLPAFQGEIEPIPESDKPASKFGPTMLYLGLAGIIFVPIFKVLTHLPPYVGMMLSLSVVCIFAEIYSRAKFSIGDVVSDHTHHSPVHHSLSKIEMPSILFFFGILMAVAALESLGLLFIGAESMREVIPNTDIVVMLLGVGSAIVDNVPLVAASMGMFTEGTDDQLWHFVAFAAGTGGSMLIIGSAAGVVAMGMLKIDFFWYLKKISWLAFIGFAIGSISFMLLRGFVG
ncbi:MAG: sodium:proton antiporter NhaD [Flavobacteriales bacterium]|jgi:Na+/H+ antiporter NhaD/arsenite permease-like protein|nr:sodium:proton antiporter NhaD [Flavobacteriales bacterium]